MRVLNTELMANPMNWIIITLMMVFGSLLVKFIFNAAELDGSTPA